MLVKLPIDDPVWSAFVEAHPRRMPFHEPAWARMIGECYRFPVFALALVDGQPHARRVVAGVPVVEIVRPLRARRWSSLPYTDLVGPLSEPADEPRLRDELDRARVDAAVETFEIGGRLAGSQHTERYVAHVLDLDPDPERVSRGFKPAIRRNVRAAEEHGLTVRWTDRRDDLVDGYFRLQLLTRRRLGLPAQPKRFFEHVWESVVKSDLGRLLLVEKDGTSIAGGFFLRANGTVVYKYGAYDPQFLVLRPNDLLFAHAIRSACLDGDRTFHFGRSDRDAEGLRRFKLGWGAVEEPLVESVLGAPRAARQPPRLAQEVIRRSPLFVAQAAGELLYRYAA